MVYVYGIAKIDLKGVRWFYNPNNKEWERAEDAPASCLINDLKKAQREFHCFKEDIKHNTISMWKYKLIPTAVSDTPKMDFDE